MTAIPLEAWAEKFNTFNNFGSKKLGGEEVLMLLMVTQTREGGNRQKDNNISISGQLLSLICTKNNYSFVPVFTSSSTRHLLRFYRIQCRFSKNTKVTQDCFELLFLRQSQFSGEEIAQT